MFESEVNSIVGTRDGLKPEILDRFTEARRTVTRRTVLPWSEHCTECVWPTCYSTCDFYEPRSDGRCRRFVDGMVRIDHPGTVTGYLLQIKFKKWAQLWAPGSIKLEDISKADQLERSDIRIGQLIQLVPIPPVRSKVTHKRYSWKKRYGRVRNEEIANLPNCMLVECYNPGAGLVSVTLTIRNYDSVVPFQALLRMEPGFTRHKIPFSDISRKVNFSKEFKVELAPNEITDGCTLFFGAMDFVFDTAWSAGELPVANVSNITQTSKTNRICKCVVFDLDNTLWDGILIEDGSQKLRLKPGIRELLNKLDERGILLSVVSKNNFDDALAALRSFGIAEFFLYPQISWDPKSKGIQRIAAGLNIGIDSLLFVDDSPFEREEVKSVCPQVEVLDAVEYEGILTRPDVQVPVTEESKKRRLLYREQQVRDEAQRDFDGDYAAFLRDCGLRLKIRSLDELNLQRVHELTQRTNQMNFSGHRYTREELQQLKEDTNVETYVLDCEDRFGAYGTIGFCTVNRAHCRMTDLMFSCRVQAKHVEHAFVQYVLRKYRSPMPKDFLVDYRKSPKNAGPGKVFDDLGFEELRQRGDVTELIYRADKELVSEGIVEIIEENRHATVQL